MEAEARFILRVTILTLAAIVIAMVLVLLAGLFSPAVDNKDIFELLKPAFQTIVGCFVGLIGGLTMNQKSR